MARSPVVEAAVNRVVSILEDDAFRRGGSITHDRLLSLASKFELAPDAIVEVRERLAMREVGIEKTDDGETRDAESGLGDAGGGVHDTEVAAAQEPPDEVRDILTSYYRAALSFPLLRPEEEKALARRVYAGKAAAEQLQRGVTAHRAELEMLVDDGDRARDRLIKANLRLVPFVAKSIRNRSSLSEEDLIQEGNMGLLRAAEKFDAAQGTRFSTYACWWIWSFMKRGLTNRGRLVRLPTHMADRIPPLLRARRALARENGGREPSAQELAEHLGWHIEKVHFVLQALDSPISLDTTSDDGLSPLGDRLMAPPEARPDVVAVRHEERGLIAILVDSLGERLSFVLRERFGLDGGEPRTLGDIAKQLGVTRERARQIEAKALEALRHPSRGRLLRDLFGRRLPKQSHETTAKPDGDNRSKK